MNPSDQNDPLEQLIDRTLRDLPSRAAPATLMSRVLSAVAERETLPWWRRAFDSWPMTAQCAFIVIAAGFATLAVYASSWMPRRFPLGIDVIRLNADTAPVVIAFKALATLHSSIVATLPPLWIYGALAIVAAIYVIALGIAAIAYRTLYASR